jgi:Mce-associated membrane protein
MAAVRSVGLRAAVQRRAPVALLAGLAGLAVPLSLHVSDGHDRDEQRTAVLAAARDEVTSLMNINYATAGRDLDRVIAGTTGDLRHQFEVQRAHAAQLAQTKSVVTGSVVSTALLWLHGSDNIARAVVAAAGTDSTGGATPSLRHYRWVLTLREVGGRWLVSDAALEGVPS